jgi:hypothetical protein
MQTHREKGDFNKITNSVRTSQETDYVTATMPNRLMLFRETVAVYCENHTEHTNTLCGQNAEFWYIVTFRPLLGNDNEISSYITAVVRQ